jgi:flavin-dependent dehydrogenase
MSHDVLVIGARVAGARLALARQGQRVMLVDRDEFPSDTRLLPVRATS